MTDKILERMARAMWKGDNSDTEWTEPLVQLYWLGHARDALEAIRVPSAALVGAAQGIAQDLVNEDHFTAFIDAILSEEEGLGSLAPLVPTELSADSVAHLLAGLREIAREQLFQHGPDDQYTVLPTHTGYEAMARARAALSRAGLGRQAEKLVSTNTSQRACAASGPNP